MSVDLSNYNISLYRGNNYNLNFKYTTNDNVGIDLSDTEAKLQIKKSKYSSSLVAELTENWPEGCFGRGLSGDFKSGFGFTGYTGGIILNYDGVTGSVYIEMDIETTFAMNEGKYQYDLQLVQNDKSQSTILRGKIEILPNSYFIKRSLPRITGDTGLNVSRETNE